MNILGSYLEGREERQRDEVEADQRWMRERGGIEPAERLAKWDAWLIATLSKTLVWPTDATKRARLLGQCAAEITVMVRQLRGRGWLLDGDSLAEHVRACIEPIGAYQRAGKVGDFWPYFRSTVRRYVGAQAEDLQALARRTGADESTQAMGALLGGLGLGTSKARGASLTELITARAGEIHEAKTLREQQAAARRAQKACKPTETPLLDGLEA